MGGRIAAAENAVATGTTKMVQKVTTVVTVGDGTISVTVDNEEYRYPVGVSDTIALINALLTPEQMQLVNDGEKIEIRVETKEYPIRYRMKIEALLKTVWHPLKRRAVPKKRGRENLPLERISIFPYISGLEKATGMLLRRQMNASDAEGSHEPASLFPRTAVVLWSLGILV